CPRFLPATCLRISLGSKMGRPGSEIEIDAWNEVSGTNALLVLVGSTRVRFNPSAGNLRTLLPFLGLCNFLLGNFEEGLRAFFEVCSGPQAFDVLSFTN